MAQAHAETDALVVSHGPHCLDGIVSAVVVARSRLPSPTRVEFTAHAEVDRLLLDIGLDPAPAEVWITDMSWTDPDVDRHLDRLSTRGTQLFWIDHHRTAINRHAAAATTGRVRFSGIVLEDSRCAAWLTYEFLWTRARQTGRSLPADFGQLRNLVTMTDDHDRWIHQRDGSHALARAVTEMDTREAYFELLGVDSSVAYTRKLAAAAARVEEAKRRSFEAAERSRTEADTAKGFSIVVAVCDGYASDIAAAWGESRTDTVFALYDRRSSTISLRRSPEFDIDLAELAERLGGGGHPGAAGFRSREAGPPEPSAILDEIVSALAVPSAGAESV